MDAPTPKDPLHAALRELPSVDHLLHQPAIVSLLDDYPRAEVVHVLRLVLDERRAAARAGPPAACDVPSLALAVRQRLYERGRPRLRRVVNATGIVLHTGLGRAPLAEEAVDAIVDTATGYCNLELDLETGGRGDRHEHLRDLLRELCAAEDGLVVNNNAAATYLTLNTLAAGREVIVSRGQLVEIGGSYRLPEIMAAAGCRLVEVGTTNRTRVSDYERAIGGETAVLLRVHTSNYRISGFTESAALAELVDLAHRQHLLVVDDLGSGLLHCDLAWPGGEEAAPGGNGEAPAPAGPATWEEPSVRDSVSGGADLTLFSGDKLLGGPQAGIVVGRADLVAALRKNPLARALRPGRLTLAALEATLRLQRDSASAARRIPVYRMLARPPASLRQSAEGLARRIAECAPGLAAQVEAADSEAGGGTLPTRSFPTWTVAVRHTRHAARTLAAALRRRETPIIARVHAETLVFDVRTMTDEDVDYVASALAELLRELETG